MSEAANEAARGAARPVPDADEVKACCAAAYSFDLVALLLGDSYHPGGLALTRRLTDATKVQPGQRVLDVASGRGTTALLLAGEYGARVVGVDLSTANVALATGAAQAAGLGGEATFLVGDAERLPVPDHSIDVVICECALCTFGDKQTAVGEFTRVLRPGGRVGITDITATGNQLPAALTTIGARIACIADARPVTGPGSYADLLETAGLRVTTIEAHNQAVLRMIDQIDARLQLLRFTATDRLRALAVDLGIDLASDTSGVAGVLAAARAAVADGTLGYRLIVAHTPHAAGASS